MTRQADLPGKIPRLRSSQISCKNLDNQSLCARPSPTGWKPRADSGHCVHEFFQDLRGPKSFRQTRIAAGQDIAPAQKGHRHRAVALRRTNSSAANVASGANAANAATSATTANAIVQRGGSGSFLAQNVTL